MGGLRAIHDVIVVGMGPGGAATASMLRAPRSFGIAGEALDVLALEARGAVPLRDRAIGLWPEALDTLGQADDILGHFGEAATAPHQVSRIEHVERTFREVADLVGVESRYDTTVRGVRDLGEHAGVEVELGDGTIERARVLVDATGARLGPFRHGEPHGAVVYLTGQLPPLDGGAQVAGGTLLLAHGRGHDRMVSGAFAFNDARAGATAYVKYPSLPARADDAAWARRTMRSHLRASGLDARGLRDVQFLTTPLVRSPSAVNGSMLAVGDAVRRLSPEGAMGVTNAIVDARGAAWAIQSTLTGPAPRAEAFAEYARAASRR